MIWLSFGVLLWMIYKAAKQHMELLAEDERLGIPKGLVPIYGPNHINESDKYIAHAAMFLNIDE